MIVYCAPSYIKVTFAIWCLKALIYLEYQIRGTQNFEIAVKLYCHQNLLKEIELFKHTFDNLQHLCEWPHGSKCKFTIRHLAHLSDKQPV